MSAGPTIWRAARCASSTRSTTTGCCSSPPTGSRPSTSSCRREIPDKGRVLTGLSAFWFARTRPSRRRTTCSRFAPDGRSLECRRLEMLPVEVVVRGYLAGSAWVDYLATGAVCGHALAAGLRESERLPEPIVTPATKATSGHDLNITEDEAAALCAAARYAARRATPRSPSTASAHEHAEARGIVVADTKFEFGLDADGVVTLADEALTPDSSRFWPATEYAPGGPQPSFDKQYVRDWCLETGLGSNPARARSCPDDVVDGTRARYVEAFELPDGLRFERLPAEPEVVLCSATVLIRPKAGILDPAGRGRAGVARDARLRRVARARRPARRARARRGRRGDARARGRAHVRRAARQPADRELRDRDGARVTERPSRGSPSSRFPARTTTATRASRSSASGADAVAVWHADDELPDRRRRRRAPGRLLVRRLPPLRRDRPRRARDGRGPRRSPLTAGPCSGSATASRSCARRAPPRRAPREPAARVRLHGRRGHGRVDRDAVHGGVHARRALVIPIKHGEGNWVADDALAAEVERAGPGRAALRART